MTLNTGTLKQDGETSLGNNNLIMAYVHCGHDVTIGNNVVVANSVNLQNLSNNQALVMAEASAVAEPDIPEKNMLDTIET